MVFLLLLHFLLCLVFHIIIPMHRLVHGLDSHVALHLKFVQIVSMLVVLRLTLPLPRLAINKIGNRVGIENSFNPTAWMHPCQKQAYEEIGQLVSIIQKTAKEEGLNMYFGNNMQLAGAACQASLHWDKTRIDFVVDEVWGRGEILPIGFYTTDGRKIFEIRGASGGVAAAEIFYMVVGMQTFVIESCCLLVH